MSNNNAKIIDRNRLTKVYPYVKAPSKDTYIGDADFIYDGVPNGYYVNGVKEHIPDGLWINGEFNSITDDFCYIDGEIILIDSMDIGIQWTGDNGQGTFGQITYSDGEGDIRSSTSMNIDDETKKITVAADLIPVEDLLFNLGSEDFRFANMYTGDLHLRNERGHWQIIEEKDCLTIINRITDKKYKFVLEPLIE
jgi:hypothetical protein